MLHIVSCRQNFSSINTLGTSLQCHFYRHARLYSPIPERGMDDLLKQVHNQHICILVHGYSNQLIDVLDAYQDIQTQLTRIGLLGKEGYGTVVGFAWPSFEKPLEFPAAVRMAKRAGDFLRELICALHAANPFSIDIQTHSLGARVALTALQQPNTYVENLLLSAPAVDNNILEPNKTFHKSLQHCNRCLVYHSSKDKVLKLWYPVADKEDGIRRALGLRGPRHKNITLAHCPNVYSIDCTAYIPEHSAYRKKEAYYRHWHRVFNGASLQQYETL